MKLLMMAGVVFGFFLYLGACIWMAELVYSIKNKYYSFLVWALAATMMITPLLYACSEGQR